MAETPQKVSIILDDDFSKLSADLDRIIGQMNDLQSIIGKMHGPEMGTLSKGTNAVANNAKDVNKQLQAAFSLGKLYFFFNYAKTMFRGLGKVISASMDYTETENKFARAMGDMYDEAMQFQSKLQEAYGLSATHMMEMQSVFKNMIGTIGGLSNQVAEKISETVSMMAIDYASLYNTSVEDAATKFQAALAKQVRPIRAGSGYDITTATLQGTLNELGMQRAVSQLSQIEQRLLIIITLQRQMANSNAMGDWARTIESPANQLRILKEQVAETARWIGSVFYGAIAGVLPILNAFVMVINKAIAALAQLFGYKLPNSSGSSGTIIDALNGASSSAGDLSNNIGSAGTNAGKAAKGIGGAKKATDKAKKSAEEWKNVLMGFDVANVLPDQSSSSGSGGSGGGGGGGGGSGGGGSGGGGAVKGSNWGVDPKLLEALKTYESLLDSITMKANQLRDAFLALFDLHVWKPFLESLFKYGPAIAKNFQDMYDDIGHILGGMLSVVEDKWDDWFKSVSDLWLSLLDTVSLVGSTITTILRHAWDSGGKILMEGIIDMVIATNKLATALNDQFVKPLIRLFKTYIAPVIGDAIGDILKAIGSVLEIGASLLNMIAENKVAIQALGVVIAGLALAKFAKHLQACYVMAGLLADTTGGRLVTALLYSTSAGRGFLTVVANMVVKLTSFFGVLSNATMGLGYLVANLAGTSKVGLGVANVLGALGSKFAWLAATPLAACGVAIAAVSAAMITWGVYNSYVEKGLIGTSKAIKKVTQEAQSYVTASKQALKDANKSIQEANTKGNNLEHMIDELDKMTKGSKGYVGNMNKAKVLVQKINEILPDTVELTESGKVIWKKTNTEIKQAIKNIKEQARQQAYANAYTKVYENQLKIQEKLNTAKKKQAENQKILNNLIQKANEELKNNGYVTQKTSNAISEYQGKTRTATQEVEKWEEANKKNEKSLKALDDSLDEYGKSVDNASEKTKKGAEAMYSDITNSSKKIKEDLKNSGIAFGEYGDKAGSEYGGNMAKALKAKAKEIGMSVDDLYAAAKARAQEKGISFSTALDEITKEEIAKKKKLAQMGIDSTGDLKIGVYVGSMDNLTKEMQDYLKKHNLTVDADGRIVSATVTKGAEGKNINSNAKLNSSTVTSGAEGKKIDSTAKFTKSQDALSAKEKTIAVTAKITKKVGIGPLAHGGFIHRHAKGGFVSQFANGGFADIKKYASAGTPNAGQLFIAREAGPELVGNLGSRHNAVANNDQIVQGIYRGVLHAMRDSHALGQNVSGDINIYLREENGRDKLLKTIKDYNKLMMSTGGKGGFVI